MLNLFEELCMMRAAAVNFFLRVLNRHGGEYCGVLWCIAYRDIYCCLPPDRILHKVFFIVGILGKWEVGHMPRLMSCWTMLVISSPGAVWAMWPCWTWTHKVQCEYIVAVFWYVCQLIGWTRPNGLVLKVHSISFQTFLFRHLKLS